jgi:hypothetical protein
MLIRLLGFCGLLLAAASGLAAPARSPALDREPRLAKNISIQEFERPLAEVLTRISRETGAPLAVTPTTAEERITLFVKNRNARELLALVADHLDFQWQWQRRRDRDVLVLVQDAAAKQRERALRRDGKDVASLQSAIDQRMKQLASSEAQSLLRQPLAERERRLAELDEKLHGAFVMNGDGGYERAQPARLSMEERDRLQREQQLLNAVTPESHTFDEFAIATEIYSLLNSEQQAAFWIGAPVAFAYPSEEGRVSLARPTAVRLVAGGLGSLSSGDDPRDKVPFHDVERVRGSLLVERTSTGTRLQVKLRTLGSFGRPGERPLRVEWLVKEAVEPMLWEVPRAGTLDEASKRLQETIAIPSPKPTRDEQPQIDLTDVLKGIAGQTPYSLIADAYPSGRMPANFAVGKHSLTEFLARTCRVFTRDCRLQNRYLTFRHTDWATKRAAEPPVALVRRCRASLERYGALRFADTVDAGRLSPEQAETLTLRLGKAATGGTRRLLESDLEQSGPVLHLLSRLSPTQRGGLERGDEISPNILPPHARSLVRDAVLTATDLVAGYENDVDPRGRPFQPGDGFALEDRLEAQWLASRIRLTRKPVAWISGEMGIRIVEDPATYRKDAEDPQLGEKGLELVCGDLIKVVFAVPGAAPVEHWFLDPTKERPKAEE